MIIVTEIKEECYFKIFQVEITFLLLSRNRSRDLQIKLKAVDAQVDAAAIAMNITIPNAPPPLPDGMSKGDNGASPPPYSRYLSE